MITARDFHAASAALALLLVVAAWTPAHAQRQGEDYDDADPWAGVKPEKRGPDSVAMAALVRALASSDPLVCQLAVASIGNNWGHWDDEYPTGNLKDEETQEARRETLGRPVGDPAAIALLIESLGSPQACVRRASARMLGRSGEPETVRWLRAALRDTDGRVREAAALGLASTEDFGAFHDLARALQDKAQPVVRMAAYALGELEDARAVKPLGRLLGADDPDTRAAAAAALGEIEDHRATGALVAALRDKEVTVRRAAAEALGEVEDPKAAGPLAQALDDGDLVVRRLAAQSLGELDNLKRAPARLIAVVSDSDPELRIIAAMSLGEIADSAVVPALSKAYAGAEPRFRYAIVKALAETDDRRGDLVLALAAKDKDQAIRHTATEALKDRHEDREDDDD